MDVGKALAGFLETLMSGRTPFDQFRDALARGAPPPPPAIPSRRSAGSRSSSARAVAPPVIPGPNFTNGEFFSTGLSRFAPHGNPIPGAPTGIRRLLESRFNLLGPYNDDATGASAAHTRQVSLEKGRFGEFKVPSLRNMMLTAPYGRDGSVETLAEVVGTTPVSIPSGCTRRTDDPARP